MALSNIFREPRREITESAVGLAAFSLYGAALWFPASWIADHITGAPPGLATVIGLFTSFIGSFILLGLAFATHEIGDLICDALEDHGLELRPKNRPGRR